MSDQYSPPVVLYAASIQEATRSGDQARMSALAQQAEQHLQEVEQALGELRAALGRTS